MNLFKKMPQAPENVRLILLDGTVVPLELRYVGIDEDGLHTWTPTHALPPANLIDMMCADTLPARTTLHVVVENPE